MSLNPIAPARSATALPERMRSPEAAEYLREHHGMPLTDKTLRNRRAAGKRPACKYLGITPLYERAELDRWVAEEALTEESTRRRNRRLAQQAQMQPPA